MTIVYNPFTDNLDYKGASGGGGVVSTLTGNVGVATAFGGNINIVTENATIGFHGSGSTQTLDFGNGNLILGSSPSSLTGILNVGVGLQTQLNIQNGQGNCTLGASSLQAGTSARDNIAIGYTTLFNSNADETTAVGSQAMVTNVSGIQNNAFGFKALFSAEANYNCAYGWFSMTFHQTGDQNCAYGNDTLEVGTTKNYCSAFGHNALNNCSGDANSAFGRYSLWQITSGTDNAAVGFNSGFQLAGASSQNAILGSNALGLATGSSNVIAIGYTAGNAYTGTESSNIVIGSQGVLGESNTIRIGTDGSGAGQQNQCFVAGISGVTVAASVPVVIDANGQMGTVVSSRRFKENIQDLSDPSVLFLRPVSFNYKKDPTKEFQVGLIAEEVAEIMPSLVVKDKDGLVETVKYQNLTIYLLAELQRLSRRVEELENNK